MTIPSPRVPCMSHLSLKLRFSYIRLSCSVPIFTSTSIFSPNFQKTNNHGWPLLNPTQNTKSHQYNSRHVRFTIVSEPCFKFYSALWPLDPFDNYHHFSHPYRLNISDNHCGCYSLKPNDYFVNPDLGSGFRGFVCVYGDVFVNLWVWYCCCGYVVLDVTLLQGITSASWLAK
jgi:hypothetical protein